MLGLKQEKRQPNKDARLDLEQFRTQAQKAEQNRKRMEDGRSHCIEEIRRREAEKRYEVEVRKCAILETEKEHQQNIWKKKQERESKLAKRQTNDKTGFAFGSSTPRNLELTNLNLVSTNNFLRQGRSISSLSMGDGSSLRHVLEREFINKGIKKRAASTDGTDRFEANYSNIFQSQNVARRKTDLMPTTPNHKVEPNITTRNTEIHSVKASMRGQPCSTMSTPRMINSYYVTKRSSTPVHTSASIAGSNDSVSRINQLKQKTVKTMINLTSTKTVQGSTKGQINALSSSTFSFSSEEKKPSNIKSAIPKLVSKTFSVDFNKLSSMTKSKIVGPTKTVPVSKNVNSKIDSSLGEKRFVPSVHILRRESIAGTSVLTDHIRKMKKEQVPTKTPTQKTSTQNQKPNRVLNKMSQSMIETISSSRFSNLEKKTTGRNTSLSKPFALKSVPRSVDHSNILNKNNIKPNNRVISCMTKSAIVVPSTGAFKAKGLVSSSVWTKSQISTEEEAKAALAERRRLAREEAKRQTELNHHNIESEQLEKIKRQKKEAERQCQYEKEAILLAEQHYKVEQERMRQSIEKSKQREEANRRKRKEEELQRLEREEIEKKAREETEKQRFKITERLKREEKEREERRRRVEAIMARTRRKVGTNTENSAVNKENVELNRKVLSNSIQSISEAALPISESSSTVASTAIPMRVMFLHLNIS